jgi:solute carrier family 35, member E3
MNLNLAHNSVGFYQLSKLACIPCTIFLDWAFRGKRVSFPIALTLVLITVGVGLATVDDVRVNVLGAVYGAVAILFASLSPILTSSYQRQLTCSSIQLLRLTSPIIASGTLLMIPLFDNIHTLRRMEPSPDLVAHVLISCGMALGESSHTMWRGAWTCPLHTDSPSPPQR